MSQTGPYEQLKQALRRGLTRGRPLKPQTERHLHQALETHGQEIHEFLVGMSERLEDFEIEAIFGPLFTPSLEEPRSLAAKAVLGIFP